MSKRARTARPSEFLAQWNELNQREIQLRQSVTELTKRISPDGANFYEHILGFKPYSYQQDFIDLFENNQFTAACWSRQSGKTATISASLLKYAVQHEKSAICVVAPSWRQSKNVLSRITSLAYGLPPGILLKPQKTKINFVNGSIIESFPNNPDRIRGPTFDVVYIDEFNFVPNDVELYDAILYTLGTTDGKFVCSSTPWDTDKIFYKIFKQQKNYRHFKTSRVTFEQALSPNGPLKPNMVNMIKEEMGDDPSRWRREMLADWAEDESVWLNQSLIASCIGTIKSCGEDLEVFNPESSKEGEFFGGLDLAQTKDYAVFSVTERRNDINYLRHIKIFQQPTIYATVLSYIKALQDRWGGFERIRVDFTREGPSFIADMEQAGIENAEGVNFSVPRKSEMAGLLKQRMQSKRFFYPLLNWEHPYRGDICNELNMERYDLRRDGNTGFSHPRGTHDDVFWSIALAIYATTDMKPEPFLAIIPRS